MQYSSQDYMQLQDHNLISSSEQLCTNVVQIPGAFPLFNFTTTASQASSREGEFTWMGGSGIYHLHMPTRMDQHVQLLKEPPTFSDRKLTQLIQYTYTHKEYKKQTYTKRSLHHDGQVKFPTGKLSLTHHNFVTGDTLLSGLLCHQHVTNHFGGHITCFLCPVGNNKCVMNPS